MTRNDTLDAAIEAYRRGEITEAQLLAAQQAHTDAFYREQTGTFIARTK